MKIERIGDGAMGRFAGSPVRRFADSPVRRFADSPVRRFADSPARRFRNLNMPHILFLFHSLRNQSTHQLSFPYLPMMQNHNMGISICKTEYEYKCSLDNYLVSFIFSLLR